MQRHRQSHTIIRMVILLVFLGIAGVAAFLVYSGYCTIRSSMPGHLEPYPGDAVSELVEEQSDDGL